MPMDVISLNQFRRRLGQFDALVHWVVLGVASGLATGLIILAFRWTITWPLANLLPGGDSENFEALPPLTRLLLPIAGSLLIALIWHRLAPATRKVGISHVLERLNYHQGRMGLRNLLAQFFGAALCLLSGQSGGREGPAVHLGAATSSLMGQALDLSNNRLRTLVGCGTAAAIAASFNTPIAGVIFAMEVVMLEYTVAGFIPILIAAGTATLVMQATLGAEVAFRVPALEIQTLNEVPFILLLGAVLGLLAVLFHRLLTGTVRHLHLGLFPRLLLAGGVTGVAALALPQIMGIGYDTVNQILSGDLTLQLLVLLALAKLLVTAVALGLGLPVGLIGPTLFIGAAAGGALGLLGTLATDQTVSDPALYAMLGMAAMMGAVLQAPLAALMALLELTLNAKIIFPGMLAVLTATLIHRHFCRGEALFQALLVIRDLNWRRPPPDRAMAQTRVGEVMHAGFIRHPRLITQSAAWDLLAQRQAWVLVENHDQVVAALATRDLQLYLHQANPDACIDLLGIPALRRDLIPLDRRTSLTAALAGLEAHSVDAACVLSPTGEVEGLLLREDINRFFIHRS